MSSVVDPGDAAPGLKEAAPDAVRMINRTHVINWTLSSLALVGVCLSGCSSGDGTGRERFVPSVDAGRKALESVLDQWRAGQIPTYLNDCVPQVGIVDSSRRADRPLESYEILGEVPGQEGHRCFAVKLSFAEPASEERARYLVVGIDPLWVFRAEDFDLLTHWDHVMDPPPSEEQPADDSGAKSLPGS